MRRAFALLVLLAAPLCAQPIRALREHIIPPATGNGARSELIALLPHSDSVAAFWGYGGPLHATVLDPEGNVLSEALVPEVENSGIGWTVIAQAGDGYLAVTSLYDSTGMHYSSMFATPLDFDFHVRGESIPLGIDTMPQALACNDARCALALKHVVRPSLHSDDEYVMALGFDGRIMNARLALPQQRIDSLTAVAHGFIATSYDPASGALQTRLFDADGRAGTVSSFGNRSVIGVTAVGDGAIVIWPEDKTLHASRLGPDGAVMSSNTIATFTFEDFEQLRVACRGSECTAAVGWYYTSYVIWEGVFFPVWQVHAVRFTTDLQPIDPAPVLISKASDNVVLHVVPTSSGSLIGWTAYAWSTARVAFLGRGATPYAGDVNAPGRSINGGRVSVPGGRTCVAAMPGAIAWTDVAADHQRTIRFTPIDGNGVPTQPVPEIVHQDFFVDAETPWPLVVMGAAGDAHVLAWHDAWNVVSYARLGGTAETRSGQVKGMFTDGRESVLVVSDYPTDNLSLLRFRDAGPPQITALKLRYPFAGALSNGKLVLQGEESLAFVDLDSGRQSSFPINAYPAAFAFSGSTIIAVMETVDDHNNHELGVRRFSSDGFPLDAQPVVITDQYVGTVFEVPLGSRFLIVRGSGYDAWDGGTISAVVYEPATRTVSPPSVIANDGRFPVALIPRDDTHAIAVFLKSIEIGDAWTGVIATQVLDLSPSDFHHRAVAP